MEEGTEVEVAAPQVAPVVLADVDVTESVPDQVDGTYEVVFLDVCVVRVEVDEDVVGADVVGEPCASAAVLMTLVSYRLQTSRPRVICFNAASLASSWRTATTLATGTVSGLLYLPSAL